MQILGLGHYSRTGKDTLANSLVDKLEELSHGDFRVKKLPFAWKLKQMCFELYGWAGVQGPDFYETAEGALARADRLPALANDKHPEGPTVVDLWIDFGTPAIRDNVYDKTWVDYVLKTAHGVDLLIIPDTRFPNEVHDIHEAGGHVLKVVRPGYGPRTGSVADAALIGFDGWDGAVGHTGDIRALYEEADRLARLYLDCEEITFDKNTTALSLQVG